MRLLIALAALACVAQVKLVDDPPVTTPPKAGKITGTIAPAKDVMEVYALPRYVSDTEQELKIKPASFNAQTGDFSFTNLKGDASYDICARLRDGRIIEGIDLAFVDARLIRLAEVRRKQLNLPPDEAPHDFSQEDADEIVKYTLDLRKNDFFDYGRVFYVKGHGASATMLVELLRDPDREFYHEFPEPPGPDGPEIIWRVELWYFKWQHGGWERIANQERVLRRVRIPVKQWEKISVEYLPACSVYIDNDGRSAPAKLRIPDKPDPKTGRLSKSDPKLQTDPTILGVTATTPAPGSTSKDDDLLE